MTISHRDKDYKTISKSKYFDKKWYLNMYPDVKRAGINPVRHYMQYGWREGRNPSPKFDTNGYLKNNQDVKRANINPLLHYEQHGKYERTRIIELHQHNPFVYKTCHLIHKIIRQDKVKHILLISHELTYTGAPLSLLKAGQILKESGYKITTVSLRNGDLQQEFEKLGRVVITNNLERLLFIATFCDFAIVNTLVAYEQYNTLKNFIPTVWWIREPSDLLEKNSFMKNIFAQAKNLYTMSPLSRDEFLKYNPDINVILHGLDDYYTKSVPLPKKPTFAVVGSICPRKGQDIFIDAIKKLPKKLQQKANFVIVGKLSPSYTDFGKIDIPKCVKILPPLSNVSSMMNFYNKISCLVVPSRQEPTSRTAIESMMMARPVIMSDTVGAQYLLNKHSGFLFQNENSKELSKYLKEIIEHPSMLKNMCKYARRAYLENNAISIYKENLLKMISDVKYSGRRQKILVHLHLFYHDQLDWFLHRLKNITRDYDLYVTVTEHVASTEYKLKQFKPDAHILHVPNRGYDIYPFWLVLQQVSLADYVFVLKMHTKNARATPWIKNGIIYNGWQWHDDLINPLIGSRHQFERLSRLIKRKGVGMVGSGNLIGDTEKTSQAKNTEQLCQKMGIKYFATCPFVCGTMFAVRSDLLMPFQQYPFKESDFSADSKTGSVGTVAHSLETVFGLLVAGHGLKIAKIHNFTTWRKHANVRANQLFIKLFKHKKNYSSNLEYIKHSRYFNRRWYLRMYPDVAQMDINPAQHYLNTGWRIGYNPSPKFDTALYLYNNPDVARAGVNPLLHYEKYGKYENRFTGMHKSLRPTYVKEYYDVARLKGERLCKITNPVVVSVTSYPARIDSVYQTIQTLKNQSVKPDKIILYLSRAEFPKKRPSLPRNLIDLLDDTFEIHWIDKTLRSFQKIIPALREFPDAILVTADDDILYTENWLKLLLDAYSECPNIIHCHRAHRIVFNKGKIAPYNAWKMSFKNESAMYNNFLTGVGGVLYPPHCLDKNILNESEFLELCPMADDIWIWAMAVKNHTKIHIINNSFSALNFVPGSQDGQCLWKTNTVEKCYNDEQLQNVLTRYPEVFYEVRRERLGNILLAYLLFPYYLFACKYMRNKIKKQQQVKS